MDDLGHWAQYTPAPAPVSGRRRKQGRIRRRTGASVLAGIWRTACFLVFASVTVCVSAAVLAYLSPDAAARMQAAAPVLAGVLPVKPPEAPAPLPAIPDAGPVAVPQPVAVDGKAMPTPGRGASPTPLGKPPVVQPRSASYALLIADAAYDPCRAVHYVTRAENMPAGGQELIRQAVDSISRATGLVFIDDGMTDEPSTSPRRAFQPERYGDRWAPLLFSWKTPAEQGAFNGSSGGKTTVGIGGSTAYTVNGKSNVYVSGEVQLNAQRLSATLGGHGGADQVRAVIEHELAHVVGLGHIGDTTQLMAETTSESVTAFGAGDLTGLALLGAGECVPEL